MTAVDALTTPHPAKLSVEDFMTLDRAGAFASYSKTELIDGTIYVVNAQYSEHMMAKVTLLRRLADACDALGGGLQAWSEGAVMMAPASMPEPDVLITKATPKAGPVPGDSLALIVEVSDTTLSFDLGKKAALYAKQGIAEYWVVDLKAKLVHQLWAPGGSRYGEKREVALGERIAAVTIAGLSIETAGI